MEHTHGQNGYNGVAKPPCMSQDRSTDDEPHVPDFYLPATAPTGETLGRIGSILSTVFRRRGGIRADRVIDSDRSDR